MDDATNALPLTKSRADGLYAPISGGGGAILDATTAVLGAWVQNIDAYLSAKTVNANGCVTAATVTWPDGNVGTYTLTAADAIRIDTPNAFVATYVGASGTRTITQSAVTRNANTGLITTRPAPTIV